MMIQFRFDSQYVSEIDRLLQQARQTPLTQPTKKVDTLRLLKPEEMKFSLAHRHNERHDA